MKKIRAPLILTLKIEKEHVPEKANNEVKKNIEKRLKKLKMPISKLQGEFSKYIPLYQDIIIDEEGNLLVLEYYKWWAKNNKLNFQVYSKEGKFICKSSFVCKDLIAEKEGSHSMYYINGSFYSFSMEIDQKIDEEYYIIKKFDIITGKK